MTTTPAPDPRGYRHPEAPWGGWQDTLVSLIREEIDQGLVVRIVLPGASKPIVVEDAATALSFVVIACSEGHRYYVGSMQGVVLLAHPAEGRGTGLWAPAGTPTPSMDVD